MRLLRSDWRRSEWTVLLGIMAVAAVLRVLLLRVMPFGFHYDEAAYAADALRVLQGEHHIFFSANNGREPLYIYLVALAFALFEPGLLQQRLVSVALGILTIPALYLLARELCGRRVALLAAFVLAILVWHINLSRLGFRVGSMVLLECLAAWLLYRAARRGNWRDWALAGLVAGASLYTYLAARALLVGFGAFALLTLLPAWQSVSLRRQLVHVGLFALVAGTIFLPLGYYFVSHYDQFAERSGGVLVVYTSPEGIVAEREGPGTALNSALRTAGLFLVQGDTNSRHNLPGRPALDPFLGLGFVVGLLAAVRRVAEPRFALLLLVLVTMLVPGAISVEAPHFLRTAGAIPVACMLVTVGLVEVRSLARRLSWPALRLAGTALIVLGLGYSSWLAVHDYFIAWALSPQLRQAARWDSNEDEIAARCFGKQLTSQGEVVLAQYPHLPREVVQALCPGPEESPRAFNGLSGLLAPGEAAAKDLFYVYPALGARADGRECTYLPCQNPHAMATDLFGANLAAVYRVPADLGLWLRPAQSIDAYVGPYLRVVGHNLKRAFTPGEVLAVDLHTRLVRERDEDDYLRLFAHLVDGNGRSWAAGGVDQLKPHTYAAGDTYVQWIDIPTPQSLPPGSYQVYVSVLEGKAMQRQRVLDGAGRDVGDSFVLATVRAVAPAASPPAPEQATTVLFGGQIRLLGYELQPNPRAGEPWRVSLQWQGLAPLREDYTVFVHVVDGEGKLVGQHDGPPQEGKLPTSLWLAEEVVVDAHEVRLAEGVRGRPVAVLVGLYELATGRRLAVVDGAGQELGDHLRLAGGTPR